MLESGFYEQVVNQSIRDALNHELERRVLTENINPEKVWQF
jgi:hypothetical protein